MTVQLSIILFISLIATGQFVRAQVVQPPKVETRIEQGEWGPEFVITLRNSTPMKIRAWMQARYSTANSASFNPTGHREYWDPATNISMRSSDTYDFSGDKKEIRLSMAPGAGDQWELMEAAWSSLRLNPEALAKYREYVKENEASLKAYRPTDGRSNFLVGSIVANEAAKKTPEQRSSEEAHYFRLMQPIEPGEADTPFKLNGFTPFNVDDHALIAVHNEAGFDGCARTSKELNALVKQFKQAQQKVIFLATSENRTRLAWNESGTFTRPKMPADGNMGGGWVGSDRKPDFALYSSIGEHDIKTTAPDITMTGGYFEACYMRAVKDVISRRRLVSDEPLNIHLPLKAIYTMQSVSPQQKCIESLDQLLEKKGIGPIIDQLRLQLVHLGPMQDNLQGSINPKDYTFQIVLDGKDLHKPIGNGRRVVRFQLWSENRHPALANAPVEKVSAPVATTFAQ